jgi:integrase
MLEGFSLGRYLMLVDCSGQLFREGKAMISGGSAAIFERLGTSAETWQTRLRKLSEERLFGRVLAASGQRLGEIAQRLHLRRAVNLGGCVAAWRAGYSFASAIVPACPLVVRAQRVCVRFITLETVRVSLASGPAPAISDLTRGPELRGEPTQEMQAVLTAPDGGTWSGRRDRVLLAVMHNTGARVSEATGLRRVDFSGGHTRSVRIRGKGRKERVVPLWKQTAAELARWSEELDPNPESPLVPNARGRQMDRSGVESRLALAVSRATASCPSLRDKAVSPHTIRHTTAMHLLQSGVDVTVIALLLGHESPETTHQYVEADLEMK